MKKLTLELDALMVESFSVTNGPDVRGTVGARNTADDTYCCDMAVSDTTCYNYNTESNCDTNITRPWTAFQYCMACTAGGEAMSCYYTMQNSWKPACPDGVAHTVADCG